MQRTLFTKVTGIYILKCLIGTAICYSLYFAFPNVRFLWSIISLLLVLAPDWDDSITLPITRIKANIAGAMIGLGCFFLPLGELLSLLIGVVVTIGVCTLLFPASTRSALAALVIVLMQEGSEPVIAYALQRIFAVMLGCLVGLGITLLFYGGRRLVERRALKDGASTLNTSS
jgi:uncharacterized membrane protein YgaE (UPF0421/DUF939 family)